MGRWGDGAMGRWGASTLIDTTYAVGVFACAAMAFFACGSAVAGGKALDAASINADCVDSVT